MKNAVDCHADAAVQCGAHCPMEHILGFTRSHWMSPSGEECSHHIAVAAAMVYKLAHMCATSGKAVNIVMPNKTYYCDF